jgi:hypothetical protein
LAVIAEPGMRGVLKLDRVGVVLEPPPFIDDDGGPSFAFGVAPGRGSSSLIDESGTLDDVEPGAT